MEHPTQSLRRGTTEEALALEILERLKMYRLKSPGNPAVRPAKIVEAMAKEGKTVSELQLQKIILKLLISHYPIGISYGYYYAYYPEEMKASIWICERADSSGLLRDMIPYLQIIHDDLRRGLDELERHPIVRAIVNEFGAVVIPSQLKN